MAISSQNACARAGSTAPLLGRPGRRKRRSRLTRAALSWS